MGAHTSGPGGRIGTGSVDDDSDGALLARVAGGDLLAYRALVDRHLGGIVGIGRSLLRDAAEAEDIAQETLIRLWRNAATIEIGDKDGGLKPWLGRVARNLAIDRLRGAKRVQLVDEVPDQPVPAVQTRELEEADTAQRVAGAIAELSENQRLALTLFHYQGHSQREIAEVLGVSQEAVESLLARARRALKGKLQATWREFIEENGS